MKYFLISLLAITLLSCFENKKEGHGENNGINYDGTYNLANADNFIEFTAYKFLNKTGVTGVFDKVEVYNKGEGKTIREALNGAEFKIPVSSIQTFNSIRNSNIIKFFFFIMKNSLQLKGEIIIVDDTSGYVNFHMNQITEKLDFTYSIDDMTKTFSMEAIMNTTDWDAGEAISSLNQACYEVHKAKGDSEAKTWNDVKINISSTFKY